MPTSGTKIQDVTGSYSANNNLGAHWRTPDKLKCSLAHVHTGNIPPKPAGELILPIVLLTSRSG